MFARLDLPGEVELIGGFIKGLIGSAHVPDPRDLMTNHRAPFTEPGTHVEYNVSPIHLISSSRSSFSSLHPYSVYSEIESAFHTCLRD